jgi:hypothetical protein
LGVGRGRGRGGGKAGRWTDPLLLVFLYGQVGGRSSGEGSAPAERSSGRTGAGVRDVGDERVRRAERQGSRSWRAARPPKIHAEWPGARRSSLAAELAHGSARTQGQACSRLQLTIDGGGCY